MLRSSTRRRGWRLIAAAMSLVLVLGSVIGLAAHTSSQGHHLQIQSVAAAAFDSEQAPLGGQSAWQAADVEEHGKNDHSHAQCGDLICHGGMTMLTAAIEVMALHGSRAEYFFCQAMFHDSQIYSFERPPNAAVLA